jgi:HD-GYP domain-containing protein (c-di-GMP phosphodiesterase class II)
MPKQRIQFAPGDSPRLPVWREAALQAGLKCVAGDLADAVDDGTTWVLDLAHGDDQLRTASEASGILGRALVLLGDPTGAEAEQLRAGGAVDVISAHADPSPHLLRTLHRVSTLQSEVAARRAALTKLNQIGYALSEVHDLDELLSLILRGARDLLQADSGSIYLIEHGEEGEPDQLYFADAQNDSLTYAWESIRIPLDSKSISGYVAVSGETVNIPDVYELDEGAPYGFNRSFDEKSGYRTISMLVVPMRNRDRDVIGVIQLMNRRKGRGVRLRDVDTALRQVIPFEVSNAEVMESLASQAAVAIENHRLYQEVQTLFDGFVGASVAAIEARDPTTGGHSGRVATLCVETAQRVSELSLPPFADVQFTLDEVTELRYAALLHDFGKIGVREHVLVKANKLYDDELQRIEDRFALALERIKTEYAERAAELWKERGPEAAPAVAELTAERDALLARMAADLEFVHEVNLPYGLKDEQSDQLKALAGANMPGGDHALLLPEEHRRLSIARGSLDESERREIESHVTQTYRYLAKIPWTRKMRNVPIIAYGHHEKLDGSGYPRGVDADQIPTQTRIMTIADIFDALTASDRPYKKAMSVDRAMQILHFEEKDGHVDSELLRLFEEQKLWKVTLPNHDG